MSLYIKLGLGTVSLGVAGGLGYAGINYLNNNEEKPVTQKTETKISDLIDKEYNHILLKTTGKDDDKYWETNWTNYKTDSDKLDKDIFGLDGWQKNSENNLTDILKEKCAQLSKVSVPNSNDSNYKNVTKYCARNVTIKDQADKEKLAIINQDSGSNNSWNSVAENKDSLKLSEHFEKLEIKAGASFKITGAEVKAGCEKALEKDKSKADYTTTYNSYKAVCVQK